MTLPGLGSDPGQGDADAIRGLAAFFRARATGERERREASLRGLSALSPVVGLSVDALRPRVTVLADRFAAVADAADSAAVILDDYALAVEDLQTRAASALVQAQSDYADIWARRDAALNAASELAVGWVLDWDDVVPSWMYLDDHTHLLHWQAAIDDYCAARAVYNGLFEEREELDQATADRLAGIPLIGEITRDDPVSAPAAAALAALWAGDTGALTAHQIAALGDPVLIREVWDSLDRTRRDALIEQSPRVIGNLDGVPLADRIAANHLTIAGEISGHEAEVARLEQMRDDALDIAYHSGDAIDRHYDNLIAEHQRMIDYYEGFLTQQITATDAQGAVSVETGARVVVFDPSAQAIATYHGPIDPRTGDIPARIESVAISVPGTGSNLTDFGDARAADLQAAAGPRSAVFQWAGGHFPQSIPEAMSTAYSHDLAPRLRDFAAGVAVPPGATLTVVGHSYGGATVGLAEAAGLKADRVLYVAAAGMGDGVSNLDDFPHTAGVPHYAMMSRNDMVVGLIQGREGDLHALHGQSTLTAEGVTRLETGMIDGADPGSTDIEDYNVPGNGMPAAIDSHSSLYTPGSTAFNNMVAVITGREAELYAEDQIIVAGGRLITIDGIDRGDYQPAYVEVD